MMNCTSSGTINSNQSVDFTCIFKYWNRERYITVVVVVVVFTTENAKKMFN